jgi:hypothetical protein
MKNFVLICALFAFLSTGAYASSYEINAQYSEASELNYSQEKKDFEKIELTELPDAVKQAVQKDDSQAVLESAEKSVLANGETIYRVTLKSETDKKTRKYHADGKKYEKDK